MFALVMTLPLDLEQRPERVAALVGMMLGLGYTIGATGPFVLGAVRDATGSFDGPLWLVVGLLVRSRGRGVGATEDAARDRVVRRARSGLEHEVEAAPSRVRRFERRTLRSRSAGS